MLNSRQLVRESGISTGRNMMMTKLSSYNSRVEQQKVPEGRGVPWTHRRQDKNFKFCLSYVDY